MGTVPLSAMEICCLTIHVYAVGGKWFRCMYMYNLLLSTSRQSVWGTLDIHISNYRTHSIFMSGKVDIQGWFGSVQLTLVYGILRHTDPGIVLECLSMLKQDTQTHCE